MTPTLLLAQVNEEEEEEEEDEHAKNTQVDFIDSLAQD
jgi:hypothetical protein